MANTTVPPFVLSQPLVTIFSMVSSASSPNRRDQLATSGVGSSGFALLEDEELSLGFVDEPLEEDELPLGFVDDPPEEPALPLGFVDDPLDAEPSLGFVDDPLEEEPSDGVESGTLSISSAVHFRFFTAVATNSLTGAQLS